MGLRFIRKPSDVPSISNIDDARSIRYAYGGQDGYILKAGTELSYDITGNIFRINSGIVVLQGWESEIDSNGWSMTANNVAFPFYYSVYYEVNLATQTTSIKSAYSVGGYPEIDKGDDLTENPTGVARLVLYQFKVENNVISDVEKKVNPILFVTLVSSRPPIMSMSIEGNITVYPGNGSSASMTNKAYGDIFRINVLPRGSHASIADIKIEQTQGEKYLLLRIDFPISQTATYVTLQGKYMGQYFSFGNSTSNQSDMVVKDDVRITITDIYGNKFTTACTFSYIVPKES